MTDDQAKRREIPERVFEPYPGAFDDILGPEELPPAPVDEAVVERVARAIYEQHPEYDGRDFIPFGARINLPWFAMARAAIAAMQGNADARQIGEQP